MSDVLVLVRCSYVIRTNRVQNMTVTVLTLAALCEKFTEPSSRPHSHILTSAHEITQLKVPLYADPRRAAELSCHFRMDEQRLHSVKWYRDMYEIFRYNPSQKVPIRLFNVTGITVQDGACQVDSCVMRVMPPPAAARAAYTCEVSTEGPKFQIVRQTKHMTVVAIPDKDPVIIGAPKLVRPGEQILLNCSSDYSLPPSDINWYIDDEIVKIDPWQRLEVSAPCMGGMRASWRVLRVSAPRAARGALRVRCEFVLPVEPPVVRHATAVITVYSLTQLSKYMSNTGNLKLATSQFRIGAFSTREKLVKLKLKSFARLKLVSSLSSLFRQPNPTF